MTVMLVGEVSDCRTARYVGRRERRVVGDELDVDRLEFRLRLQRHTLILTFSLVLAEYWIVGTFTSLWQRQRILTKIRLTNYDKILN